VPSRNILVEDCEFRDGHGGVTIGSEMTGGVGQVFARNLRMTSPNLNSCLRLKTNSMRGGYIHDVYMRDVDVTLAHSRFDKATSPDIVENVDGLVLTDVIVNGSPAGAAVH
jgi:polygalacturonase